MINGHFQQKILNIQMFLARSCSSCCSTTTSAATTPNDGCHTTTAAYAKHGQKLKTINGSQYSKSGGWYTKRSNG